MQAVALSHPPQQVNRTSEDIFQSLNFRTFYPVWELSTFKQSSNGNTVIITPIYRKIPVSYPQDLYFIRRLRTELNPENLVIRADVVEILSKEISIAAEKDNIITNIFSELKQRTDAKIIVRNLAYDFLAGNNWIVNAKTESDTCYQLVGEYVNVCGTILLVIFEVPVPCPSYGNECQVRCGEFRYVSNNGKCGGSGGGGAGGQLPAIPIPPQYPPYTPPSGNNDPPTGGGGNPPHDWGQDQIFDPNYLPPHIEDPQGIYKAYKTALLTDLDATKAKIQNFGTSPILDLQKMVNYWRIRQGALEKAIADVKAIEASTQNYKFISMPPDANGKLQGETSYDVANNQIVIAFPQSTQGKEHLGLKAHEVHHAVQFLAGKLSFDKTTGKGGVLYDLQDEVECYQIQYPLETNEVYYGTVDIDGNPSPNFTVNTTTVLALGIYNALPTTQITINSDPQGTTLQNAGANATDIFVKP